MARAIWSGSISFGLVNIPVKLFTAVSRKTVRFNQIDAETGARVKQKRVSAADGEEVPYDRIVKGFELSSGDFVTVTEDELAALDPEAGRTIDIAEFVDLADIDPIFYDSAYYLVPDAQTAKPYKLLANAMEEAGKVGICHFVMRTKQYLAAVRPKDGRLVMSTMVYADEVVDPAEISGFDLLDDIEIDPKEQAMAEQLISTLDAEFEPAKHTDTYREAVLDLIDRKAAGETGDDLVPAPCRRRTRSSISWLRSKRRWRRPRRPASGIPPPVVALPRRRRPRRPPRRRRRRSLLRRRPAKRARKSA